MTTEFVLRFDKRRAEHLKREARRRRKTPNALMRQALDNLIGEPNPGGKTGKATKRRSKEKTEKETKGVGWAEHFKWLREHGRRVDSKVVDEILAISRSRPL